MTVPICGSHFSDLFLKCFIVVWGQKLLKASLCDSVFPFLVCYQFPPHAACRMSHGGFSLQHNQLIQFIANDIKLVFAFINMISITYSIHFSKLQSSAIHNIFVLSLITLLVLDKQFITSVVLVYSFNSIPRTAIFHVLC